jgi:hypothetical protein
MAKYSHIIMRQRLTIDIPDKRYQQEIQRKVQRIVEQRLNEILENTFSACVPKDVVITLDQLHINLTDTTPATLEESVLQQIHHKLPILIKEQVNSAIKDPLKRRITPLPEAKLEAVRHYLLHGYFAWWMPANDEKVIEDLYTEIYRETPTAIKALWAELSEKPSAVRRFVTQFSRSTVEKSIHLFNSIQAEQVLNITEDFSKLYNILSKVVPSTTNKKLYTDIRNIVLSQSIQTLSTDRKLNEANLIRVCLQQIAKNFDISYPALITNLSQGLLKQQYSTSETTGRLAKHIIHLHDTQVVNTPSNHISAQAPQLIKQLNNLLIQEENINKQEFSHTINQIFIQAKNPAVKNILISHLASISHIRQLTKHLSASDFIRFVEIIQPTIQNAFVLTKQIWNSVMPLEIRGYQLIEQLTVKYLSKRAFDEPQSPTAYLSYLIRKLNSYVGKSLKKWNIYIKQNKEELGKVYTNELVEVLVGNLLTTNDSIQTQLVTKNSKLSTDNFFLETINNIAEHPEFMPGSALTILLESLNQHLSLFLQTDAPITLDLEKKVAYTVKHILKHVITDKGQRQWATQQFVPWINKQAGSSISYKSKNGLHIFKDKLTALLTNQDAIREAPTELVVESIDLTIPLIKDFFTHQLLPPGYTHQPAVMATIIKQLVYVPGFQSEFYNLLQQQSIRKQLVKNIAPSVKSLLINTLIPMSINMRDIYEDILLKADVLRADTSTDKEALLEDIFLEAISHNLKTSEESFIQYSLLIISYNTQLPKQEVYRRVQLSAQKYEPTISLTHKIQHLAPIFEGVQPTIADVLDKSFLPIFDLLKGFLAPQKLTSALYGQLLAFMKSVIEKRLPTATIDKELHRQLNLLFSMLSDDQKQILFNTIKKIIQDETDKQLQTLQKHWLHFLDTGELPQGYNKATELFNNLLVGTSSKVITDTSPLPTVSPANLPAPYTHQLRASFMTTLQAPHARKRLVSSLPTQDLEEIVRLVAKDKSGSIINYINNIYEIWSYTGTANASCPSSKLLWWESALSVLLSKKKDAFLEKSWLSESLSVFAKSLAIPFSMLLSSLTMYAKTSSKPFNISKEKAEELDEILIEIEHDWDKKAKQEARKNWPTQPTFQKLYQLFSTGFSSLSKGTTAELSILEQQLSNLANQQATSVKQFFYTYADPSIISQQIAYYFSTPLIKQLIYCLDSENHQFVEQYIEFSISHQSEFHHSQDIDAFSWRKHIEIATLTYFLEKKEKPFKKQGYLRNILENTSRYVNQEIQLIVESLTNYYIAESTSNKYEEIIQELNNIIGINKTQQATEIKQDSKVKENEQREEYVANLMVQPTISKVQYYQKEFTLKPKRSIEEKPVEGIKVYIRNSGLVFLWPFLERLLEKQDLLEKQVFFSNLERSNAVHTLQYLVTEQLSTPDWRLILNKLLCGMAYNDIPFSGYYLWDKKDFAKRVLEEQEKALVAVNSKANKKKEKLNKSSDIELPEEVLLLRRNTDELLANVLAEWTSLKNLEKFEAFRHGFGVQEFRKYILQRDGLLQYVDQGDKGGYWHLTITWEDYDSAIKKVPWPINKIYLPFMQEQLVVFWAPS